jgi:pimeloyl-ACP methyl ester carboxylesterase
MSVATQAQQETLTSADGTTIGYRKLGTGPGLVILHGAMESSTSHLELAEALAEDATVYLPDRRGRGLSGPVGQGPALAEEVADLAALLSATGASNVLGVSSGAIVLLAALRAGLPIERAVVFEPPLVVDGSISLDFVGRYRAELTQGDLVGALVTGMLGTQMGPPLLNRLPRPVLRGMTRLMMASERRHTETPTMRELAPTLGRDFDLVAAGHGLEDSLAGTDAKLLLLGGDQSPRYLQQAVAALAARLPQAERLVLPGLGHGATGNRDRGGRADRVAPHLRVFLSA